MLYAKKTTQNESKNERPYSEKLLEENILKKLLNICLGNDILDKPQKPRQQKQK